MVGASKFGAAKKTDKAQKRPQREEYIANRDYTGAIALLGLSGVEPRR